MDAMNPSRNRAALGRRSFLKTAMLGGAAAAAVPLAAHRTEAALAVEAAHPAAQASSAVPAFELDEITLAALQDGMKSGKFTARSLTEKYLARIDEIDKRGPGVNSVLEVNPDALSIADELDKERQTKGPRGPLARHPSAHQRQHRDARPHANDGRLAGAGRSDAAQGLPSLRRSCATRAPSFWARPT